MFISVTRQRADRSLRLAVAAIAYVDIAHGGAIVRLIGGESLHVEEEPATIERLVEAVSTQISAVQRGDHRIEYRHHASREMVAGDLAETPSPTPAPAPSLSKRKTR